MTRFFTAWHDPTTADPRRAGMNFSSGGRRPTTFDVFAEQGEEAELNTEPPGTAATAVHKKSKEHD